MDLKSQSKGLRRGGKRMGIGVKRKHLKFNKYSFKAAIEHRLKKRG